MHQAKILAARIILAWADKKNKIAYGTKLLRIHRLGRGQVLSVFSAMISDELWIQWVTSNIVVVSLARLKRSIVRVLLVKLDGSAKVTILTLDCSRADPPAI